MRTFAFVSLACLLAGCAAPEKTATTTTTTTTVVATKPACDRSATVTGSHMMGNCDRSGVLNMDASGIGTMQRKGTGATLSGN
jgi:hypothetical protein